MTIGDTATPLTAPQPRSRFEVIGADATNLVGYFFALGALLLLEHALPASGVTLRWNRQSSWFPVLELGGVGEVTELASVLRDEALKLVDAVPVELGKDLPPPLDAQRAALLDARARGPDQWLEAAVLSGMAIDIAERFGGLKKERRALDTALRTMTGAGHQHFLGTIRELVGVVTVEGIKASLGETWRYDGRKLGLRWDPIEDRRHAFMASDPTAKENEIRTEHASTLIAWSALAMLPVLTQGRDAVTVAGRSAGRRGAPEVHFRLPIWREPLSALVVSSLIVHGALWRGPLDAARLERVGVAEVVQFRRYPNGKYRNFSPGAFLLGG